LTSASLPSTLTGSPTPPSWKTSASRRSSTPTRWCSWNGPTGCSPLCRRTGSGWASTPAPTPPARASPPPPRPPGRARPAGAPRTARGRARPIPRCPHRPRPVRRRRLTGKGFHAGGGTSGGRAGEEAGAKALVGGGVHRGPGDRDRAVDQCLLGRLADAVGGELRLVVDGGER